MRTLVVGEVSLAAVLLVSAGLMVDNLQRLLNADLGLQADPGAVRDINNSPALARYSKAQDHAYTAETRSEIMRESRQHNAVEIARGRAWLDAMARIDNAAGAIVAAAIR